MEATKSYSVCVTTRLVVEVPHDVGIEEVLSEMDYDFIATTEGAKITDTEIINWDYEQYT